MTLYNWARLGLFIGLLGFLVALLPALVDGEQLSQDRTSVALVFAVVLVASVLGNAEFYRSDVALIGLIFVCFGVVLALLAGSGEHFDRNSLAYGVVALVLGVPMVITGLIAFFKPDDREDFDTYSIGASADR